MTYLELKLYTTFEEADELTVKLEELVPGGFSVEDPRDFAELAGTVEASCAAGASDAADALDAESTPNASDSANDANVSSKGTPKPERVVFTVYLDDTLDGLDLLDKILSEADYISITESTIRTVSDDEWKDKWKAYFKPAKVSDTIVVQPLWEPYEAKEGEKIIEIDPEMAFGTGTHETTSLCIQMLEKYLPEMPKNVRVLDVGCGSGILSFAAKLVAENAEILGVDIDPVAVNVSNENAKRNHMEDIQFRVGDLTKGIDFKANVVVANLLAYLVTMLTKDVSRHIQPGGIYISSGILVEQLEDVKRVIEEAGFTILETPIKGEWCAIVAKAPKKKIAFYTLGCKVNQYETEALRENFTERGWEAVDAENPADVFVVNTCTVTSLADRKSRQYIRRMKRQNPDCITAVIGCYAQVSPEEAAAVEGVDLVLGNAEKADLAVWVEHLRLQKHASSQTETVCAGIGEPNLPETLSADGISYSLHRVGTAYMAVGDRKAMSGYREMGTISAMENRTRAYIKIQEGCDRFCTYCVIPYARGPVRSRDPESVVSEAKRLLEQGFKEIVLTGINTALYGSDAEWQEQYGLKAKEPENMFKTPENANTVSGLEILLEQLEALPYDFRIRLSSLEPTVVDPEDTLRLLKFNKLCHHLHLSAQSGSNAVLKAMNRHYDRERYLRFVKNLRQSDPGYGISTDVIVGFPGETEEDFAESADLIRQVGFVHSHIFPYSKRPGTAAAAMENQIAPPVKKERAARLGAIGANASKTFCETCRGQKRRVLWEQWEDGYLTGYADNYIKVYKPCDNALAGKLSNTFEWVTIGNAFREGVQEKSY